MKSNHRSLTLTAAGLRAVGRVVHWMNERDKEPLGLCGAEAPGWFVTDLQQVTCGECLKISRKGFKKNAR